MSFCLKLFYPKVTVHTVKEVDIGFLISRVCFITANSERICEEAEFDVLLLYLLPAVASCFTDER